MNRKLLVKVIEVALLTVLCCIIISTTAQASSFLKPPKPQESSLTTSATDIGGQILSIVQVIGASVAIIILVVLGIKYMSASPNDRAEIKKHAVVYVVGAVVLFASSALVGIIRGFAKNALNGETTVTASDGTTTTSDSEGRPIRIEKPDGTVIEYDYDNNVVTTTAPDGTQTTTSIK